MSPPKVIALCVDRTEITIIPLCPPPEGEKAQVAMHVSTHACGWLFKLPVNGILSAPLDFSRECGY